MTEKKDQFIIEFEFLSSTDIPIVGGKNASLGEMVKNLAAFGIAVPPGFAITAHAYWDFLKRNQLEEPIKRYLQEWDMGKKTLDEASEKIRELFSKSEIPEELKHAIVKAYQKIHKEYPNASFAVRSSATAEDLPEASFAGQQETFLNVSTQNELLESYKKCIASLFGKRAISYRKEKKFDLFEIGLSVGVQKMVRSDQAASGVLFTLDTETGFPDVVLITASWGLGETIVGGKLDPDEYLVFKPLLDSKNYKPILKKTRGSKKIKAVYDNSSEGLIAIKNTTEKERENFALSDDDILLLAKWACLIEKHYGTAMDIEWAKDGESGKLFIVQARPETVQSHRKSATLSIYKLKERSNVLTEGLAIGEAIATGQVCVIQSPKESDKFIDGGILVTEMTDPDWSPIFTRASAIITDKGGRTAHAAIVSRELGIPAIVGTGNATEILKSKECNSFLFRRFARESV